MSERVDFIKRCLGGDVLDPQSEVDDEIDQWHDGGGFGVTLHQWLGMTWEEYALFVEKPWTLRAILAARHTGESLMDMVKVTEGGTSLAARGVPAEEFAQIQQWLRTTHRI